MTRYLDIGCVIIVFLFHFQVFDAFIVLASFFGDIILLMYVPHYSTRDFVFILAFLLPWRVIRVVDSKYSMDTRFYSPGGLYGSLTVSIAWTRVSTPLEGYTGR